MDKFFKFLDYLEDKYGEFAGILGYFVVIILIAFLAAFLTIITQGWVWIVILVLLTAGLLKNYGEFSIDYKDKNQ